jgi:cobalt/nickel transport protein
VKKFVLVMLALSLVIAGGLSHYASSHPDGLEKVAQDKGFAEKAKAPSHTVLPGYTIPGLGGGLLANMLAGIAGVAVTFGVVVLAGKLARRRRKKNGGVP